MNIQEHEKRKEENAQIKRMIEKEAEKNERREQEQKDRDANRDRELEVVRTLLETPAGKKMLAELGDDEESEIGGGVKPTALFGDDGDDSPLETDVNGEVIGVAPTKATIAAAPKGEKDQDIATELARLKLENAKLKKENNDLLIPDDHQTLKERAQNAKHVDPAAVGRTAASVKKHIKEAKSARKGKKQAEHVRREGLRSRTRSQTNSRA